MVAAAIRPPWIRSWNTNPGVNMPSPGVRDQVDKQQMNRGKWQRKACKGGIKDTEDTRHIAGKEKLDGIFNIAVDISAVGSSLDDRGKVIICQDHGRSLL